MINILIIQRGSILDDFWVTDKSQSHRDILWEASLKIAKVITLLTHSNREDAWEVKFCYLITY